ncbi:hypothetical protein [Tumebacillus flagellatus]|uniref:Uncharacterized protein n=1 Tax=Tumebacillus flagellatus TaxID=1157490 RepID=A0A074LS96_9BACL|nr:hypothetical protein [Tumebacillus flagellatus]KEO83994.1 hypothetical protein EL26_07360 [Tumebacillus flagellatus]
MKISRNKDKNIGRVLFIVEGEKTEFWLLRRIFKDILDYQYEYKKRMGQYRKVNEKEKITSSVCVVNAQSSAITSLDDSNEYLNQLFAELIEVHNFPVDRAAIYYLFDRDGGSNKNSKFILDLIDRLGNATDNGEYRQGLLLLSYPAVESFVASNFISGSYMLQFEYGHQLKHHLHAQTINQSRISEETLQKAVEELVTAIEHFGFGPYDVSSFHRLVFEYQEQQYQTSSTYSVLSLLAIVLLDLGIFEVVDE